MAHELEFNVLGDRQIDDALQTLPGWEHEGKKLVKTFTHNSFLEAIAFVNRVAVVAEQYNHHPDFDINFKRVMLSLWTHKKDAITQADVTVAEAIEKIA